MQTGTIGLTEQFTPAISNEVRANYSNDRLGTTTALDNFGGAVPLPDSLMFPPGYSSANSLFRVLPPGRGRILNRASEGRTSSARSILSTIFP